MKTNNINLNGKNILVTGAVGFIGSNLVVRLLKDVKDATIIGIDNMNDYYDVRLKEYRLAEIEEISLDGIGDTSWYFIKGDISNKATIDKIFEEYHPLVRFGRRRDQCCSQRNRRHKRSRRQTESHDRHRRQGPG